MQKINNEKDAIKKQIQTELRKKNNELEIYKQLCMKGSKELMRENRLMTYAFYELGFQLYQYTNKYKHK